MIQISKVTRREFLAEAGGRLLGLLSIMGPLAGLFFRPGSGSHNQQVHIYLVGYNPPESPGARWEPGQFTVRQGDQVHLHLTSADVVHGFKLVGYPVAVDWVYPGEWTEVTFTAHKRGKFLYACSTYCGKGHTEMLGMMVVKP